MDSFCSGNYTLTRVYYRRVSNHESWNILSVTAGTSIPIAGATILFVTNVILKQKITIFKSWKLLLIGSLFLAAAVFTWYDSVSRVGDSKEGLLAGPLETVIVLILAWLLLKEKLRTLQTCWGHNSVDWILLCCIKRFFEY